MEYRGVYNAFIFSIFVTLIYGTDGGLTSRLVIGGDKGIFKPFKYYRLNETKPTNLNTDDDMKYVESAFSTSDPRKDTEICRNCVCGVGRSTRIVNGDITSTEEFPWVAAIQRNGEHHCGASLITSRHVLTAAHCFYGFNKKQMVVRLADESQHYVKSARVHEKYDRFSFNNDIAVLELDRPINVNKKVKTVCLPSAEALNNSGQIGVVIGWGRVGQGEELSSQLRKVDLPIMSDEQCKLSSYPSNRMTDNMFCAGYLTGGQDSCQGDSGGPLHVRRQTGHMEVVGIVSFGRGCARPYYPGVYTKVANYIDWISQNVKGECACAPPS